MTDYLPHFSTVLLAVNVLLVLGVSIRVIMKRPAVGVALAWLFVVGALPIGGAILYLAFGERWVSSHRARRIQALRATYVQLSDAELVEKLTAVDWDQHPSKVQGMNRLGWTLAGFPTLKGSTGVLLSDTGEMLRRIAEDVDRATKSVLMEFYIWNEGGGADEVLEALIRAAGRGVSCRVLIDAIGARPWWKGNQPRRLRQAGVQVREALPLGFFRRMTSRTDLRLHRKIVVIDGEVAWTGSMNLVDPRFFKQDANVGEWVDAMIRAEGPVVTALGAVMVGDWNVETGESVEEVFTSSGLRLLEPGDGEDAQVVPSGPSETDDALLQMLLSTINLAQDELVLTTPYFVPDESLLRALRGAAGRGVKVKLIVPRKVDSLLTRYASRSYYVDLTDIGVEIHLYDGGLLHTKSITADRRVSMFGTVNLDMRSLWLNYEVAVFVYGPRFGTDLRELQETYLADSERLDPATWARRPATQRFLENAFRLFSPLL